ncbi:hypothetical protein BGZ83_010476 [Gryganskiella cystojenkinii]|nr:hypothetical protein BGZ83_010476 [Gryganskiella cystojenkinii]
MKSDSEPWSILENLVLAQAIYKCGDTNWVAIARTIKAHPQIHRTNIPSVVKLAGHLYHQRILEIKGLIRKDEERFRELVAELDEIRQGKWDRQLEQELQKNPPPPTETESNSTDASSSTLSSAAVSSASTDSNLSSVDVTSKATQPIGSSSLAISVEKQEGTDQQSNDTSESVTPAAATTPAEKLDSKASTEHEDVEMTDAVESKSTPGTPSEAANASSTAVPPVEEDTEMEDATGDVAPSAASSENVTPASLSNKESEQDSSSRPTGSVANNDSAATTTSSSTSELDHSPSEAMDQEESGSAPASESRPAEDTKNVTEDNIKTNDQDEQDLADKAALRKGSHTKEHRSKASVEPEDESKESEAHDESQKEIEEDEEEEESNDMEEDKVIAKQEIDDDGDDISSAGEEEEEDEAEEDEEEEDEEDEEEEEEEEESTKTSKRVARKPQKISTNTPLKRKRRGGHRGDTEDGYNSSDSETIDSANTTVSDQLTRVQMVQMDDKKWKKILMMIWTDIANHRFGAVFMQPIKEHDAPGYYQMIKRPMDLKSIKERIREGLIGNADEFHRDVLLMFMNALMYNSEETEVHQMALAMMSEVELIIKNFKSSQSYVGGPTSSTGSGGPGGGGGSGNSSATTTPTTKTAEGAASTLSSSSAASGGTSTSSSRRRKSSGIEMTPTE